MTTDRSLPSQSRFIRFTGWALLLALCGCTPENPPDSPVPSSPAPADTPAPAEAPDVVELPDTGPAGASEPVWTALFDGQQLGGWRASEFATQGEVTLRDNAIHVQGGETCSGITWDDETEELPRHDYELQLQAKRVEGQDFFCGLTFPVNDECCSLIVGGWGGGLVGLSCLDGFDASENDTASFHDFDQDRWYTIRVRVRADHISAWIDDSQVVDADLEGREVSIRPEVYESQPLGIATWQTSAMFRKIELRTLPPQPTEGDEQDP